MSTQSTTRALLRASRTLTPSPLKPTTLQLCARRFASTKVAAPRPSIYWSTDVYWGKAVKNVGNALVLYIPVVTCIMFWPTTIAPFFNLLKGVKKMEVEA
ncbi:hypothetical protein DSL72_005862 [Monilinia vaccinii-corymbosi]|uniref:Uncharacterized protein n=1 Tax=Monilinia vaccinii-corymbosi TaxID=61207 RepID=A0A8A3PG85_9HELO|nr:hypothetical protein DSL72_005862 [Monilinia vaccinii-corymbosi]